MLGTAGRPALRQHKSVPAWLDEELVPEVHGRAPRAARTAYHDAQGVARVGRACGPSGSSGLRALGLGFVFAFALLEAKALAIHLKDMDVVCEPVEERAGETFRSEDLGPFIEGQIRGDQC